MENEKISIKDYDFNRIKKDDTVYVYGTAYRVVATNNQDRKIKIAFPDSGRTMEWHPKSTFEYIVPLNINWKKILEGGK